MFISDHRTALYWHQRQPRYVCCGCYGDCRCDHRNYPTEKRTDAYLDAIDHLADVGVCAAALTPELRKLWRRGGAARATADRVRRRWTC